ncbi:MAG: Lipid A biosynthesis lauroyltransferase [Elusimicrobia bacterium]|nr:Lipid A biosynthesis lauroyltransferase [Elusimicrobiota bacterium]
MPSFFSNFLETLGASIFEFLAWFFAMFPRRFRYPLVSTLGALFGLLAWNMRKALRGNLQLFLPKDGTKLNQSQQEIFRNFALTLCDFFLPDGVLVHVPDRNKLEKLRQSHPGILLLTFHMGHWELGARTMKQWGWPVTAVYQPYKNKKFKKSIESRRAEGVNFIPVGGEAANGVRAALRRGDVVAMLGDLPFGEDGIEVHLFGRQILWPKGPVILAMREHCPIVVAVVVRTGMGEYTAFIQDPLFPQSKGKSEVKRLTQEIANIFSKFVHLYPMQWYRFRSFEFVKN